MSQPQTPGPWYPPPPPEKKGIGTGAIVAIIVVVVVVVVIVGALAAYAFFAGIQQSANLLAQPNVTVTNAHGTYLEDCGAFGSQTTQWSFTADLVNTGGAGYAVLSYDVNGQTVTTNNYYVAANTQIPVSDGVTVHACYSTTTPTYDIILLSQRPA